MLFWFDQKIETSFLVPIKEDADLGNGRPHSKEKWETLRLFLENLFDGQTRARDTYPGTWVDTSTNKTVSDESRKYFVDVKRRDIKKMKDVMRLVAIMFKQKCIRFEYQGKVELIYSHEMWRGK
jgi:hypothetical protein